MLIFSILLLLAGFAQSIDLFCKEKNCYDLLGVTKDSSGPEIQRAFKLLSRQLHPDRNSEDDAQERYSEISNAYDILSNDELRADYDDFLANPVEHPSYYYMSRYYYRRYAKINPIYVVLVTLIMYSGLQYWNGLRNHDKAIRYFRELPEHVEKAHLILEERGHDLGILDELASIKSGRKLQAKMQQNEARLKEIEILVDAVISENITGGYKKPLLSETPLAQVILLPYTIPKFLYDQIAWYYKFNILNQPYGPEERELLTRRALSMSQDGWLSLEEDERKTLIGKELWIKDNFKRHKEDQEQEQREKYEAKFKQYKRFMKKRGNARYSEPIELQ